jgi:hypothetical protein
MPGYDYSMQYADTESANPPSFKRMVNPNANSQWGSGLTLAPGPWPPGYRVANGQVGGAFPPQGSSANTSLGIRIQPPTAGSDGKAFMFYTWLTCTVLNESNADCGIIIALGVIDPSETGRPMNPYLGVYHAINDFRLMVPVNVPAGKAVQITATRMDVLDPRFAAIPGWPNWQMTPGANKLFPAICPTFQNRGPNALNVKDVMVSGVPIPY